MGNKKYFIGGVAVSKTEYQVAELAAQGYAKGYVRELIYQNDRTELSSLQIQKALDRVYGKLGFKAEKKVASRLPGSKGTLIAKYDYQSKLTNLFRDHQSGSQSSVTLRHTYNRNHTETGDVVVESAREILVISEYGGSGLISWRKAFGIFPPFEQNLTVEVVDTKNIPIGTAVLVEHEPFDSHLCRWRVRFDPPIMEPGRRIEYTTRTIVPDAWLRSQVEQKLAWKYREKSNKNFGVIAHFSGRGYAVNDLFATESIDYGMTFPTEYPAINPSFVFLTFSGHRDYAYEQELCGSDQLLINKKVVLKDYVPGTPVTDIRLMTYNPKRGRYAFCWDLLRESLS